MTEVRPQPQARRVDLRLPASGATPYRTAAAVLGACATAAAVEKNRPPSEKESGVTLTTPMISGRASDSLKLPQSRNIGEGVNV